MLKMPAQLFGRSELEALNQDVSILLVSSGVEKYHQKLIDGCLNGHSRKVGPHSLHQAHCVMRESLALGRMAVRMVLCAQLEGLRKDGTRFVMSLSLAEAAHATPQGLRQFVAFIRDITKQEQMVEVRAGTVCSSGGVHADAVRHGPLLQKLQSSTQLLHDVFNAVTDGLIIANLSGDIVSVNHATGLPCCDAGAFYLLLPILLSVASCDPSHFSPHRPLSSEEMFGFRSHELVGTSLSTYLVAPGVQGEAGDIITRYANSAPHCTAHVP
jgi:hypothetical protein